MDGAMAQDKNKLDALEDDVRADPVLPPPGEGALFSTADSKKDPAFETSAPVMLLPPPLPKSASVDSIASAMSASPPAGFSALGLSSSGMSMAALATAPVTAPAFETAPPLPPELPKADKAPVDEFAEASEPAEPVAEEPSDAGEAEGAPRRRMARRRSAGPSRNRIAANDDGPSIGGLIFALQQKPSNAPFRYAAIASAVWVAIGAAFTIASMAGDASGMSWIGLITRPMTFLTLAATLAPVGLIWLMALLAWRAEELRLRSSTMTEVAIRLAEPDRLAEQNAASLGQAVRRQVGFMNDAISRALGRAGELEAMVHNEVSVLERSYEDNERKIRGLISELSGERHALVNTSDRVSESLMRLGSEIPTLIEKLSDQQVKLAKVIEGAGENLTMLETSMAQSVGQLESSVGGRTQELQSVLENYTTALGTALGSRAEQLQTTFDSQLLQLDSSLANRTENLQTVFEEYARALDAALANRAQALDYQLVERTRSLDDAFGERLRLFDESIMRSTQAIDSAVVDKTQALTNALDAHAITFRETIGKQAHDLDDALMHGINSVRRASENITRQSIKAMEGLANQSSLLQNISENLLTQIGGITGRFENQGQQIIKAANALETVNFKIDKTLQNRHGELSDTLDRLSNKADEFSSFVGNYSSSIAGSLNDADQRARHELDRVRASATAESERTLEDLRNRLNVVSTAVTSELGSLTNRFTETSEVMRQQASRTASEIAAEQSRLRSDMERLPTTAQESSEGMRRALHDQIKALDQLSQLAQRTAAQRDVIPPPAALHSETIPPMGQPSRRPPPDQARSITSLSSTIAQELGNRQRTRGGQPDAREGWSLGDLLSRASRDEDGHGHAGAGPQQGAPTGFGLDLQAISRALDPATAAAIWARIRSGQRGVMVRSIYGNEGRALFDDVSHRCRSDAEMSRTVSRYLSDFERIVGESDQRDPSGRLSHGQLVSDTGRVYLFLAHASGRLS
jgi:hypothetical protein